MAESVTAELQKGEQVRIWPLGHERKASLATVVIISGNQLSIAVQFEDRPLFTRSLINAGALGIDTAAGKVTMMLLRFDPAGPWQDIKGGGWYVIEPDPQQGREE